jgi:hypothetical protein
MKQFIVNEDVLMAVVNYLDQRVIHKEARPLIDAIQKGIKEYVEPVKEEVKNG